MWKQLLLFWIVPLITTMIFFLRIRSIAEHFAIENDHTLNITRTTIRTSSDYFKVLQARLIAGQFYTEADDSSKPRVVMINRALAKWFFPDEDPVGRMIGDVELSPKSLARIIGVVDDVREGDLVEPLAAALDYPFKQDTDGTLFLVARTGQAPAPMLPSLSGGTQNRRIDKADGVHDLVGVRMERVASQSGRI